MSIYNGRTPCGVRGLKCTVPTTAPSGKNRRTPCGVRGLKFEDTQSLVGDIKSHPVWGAWIEMPMLTADGFTAPPSHPVWGAWIEILWPVSPILMV